MRYLMDDIISKYNKLLEDNGGIYFPGIIEDEKKSENILTPIFENITNALEAIKLKTTDRIYTRNDSVNISLYFSETANTHYKKLMRIDIEDTGIGFSYEQFLSFTTYKYNKKGFNNKGCGRFQSLLFFEKSQYVSRFNENNNIYMLSFDFSKSYTSSKGVKIISFEKDKSSSTGTTVSLFPAKEDVIFDALDDETLKNEIIKKYSLEFLLHEEGIPNITITSYINEKIQNVTSIQKDIDIPTEKKETEFSLYLKQINNAGELEDTKDVVTFSMTTIPFNMDVLGGNEVYICCKNETIKNIEFNAFAKDDNLENKRFLNFVSSKIFDQSANIDNCRSNVKNILKTEEQIFHASNKKQSSLFVNFNKFILQEELENKVADCFYNFYPVARKKETIKQQKISALRDLFDLEDNARLSIKTSDSNKDILEKYYRSEALKQANLDAAFSEVYKKITSLDINDDSYEAEFAKLNQELNEKIPLRNKRALSKYLTNRKIVLELFSLTIDKKLKAQTEDKRKEEEKRLHNILFKQHSSNAFASNLWLLNEEFIYFTGYSEFQLNKLLGKNNEPLFDFSNLNETDKNFLENRDQKRPDIILFPNEGKCIIIELKAPGVPINKYIGQTEDYARIIASCVSADNKIDMFYSYLIVEEDNIFDIPSEYEEMYNFKDAYFLPSKKIKGVVNGKRVELGFMYGEILRYKDIYERAKLRHKIFEDIISSNGHKK